MPVLSSFYGIADRLYYSDHEPAHFHARYAEHEAQVHIDTGSILRGSLPRGARRLVEELQQRWQAAQAGMPLEPIEPLP